MSNVLRIQTAKVFTPLLRPSRYKGAYGGRGSGKSHFFAEKLLEDCLAAKGDYGEGMRAVCIREVQKDLAQSSKLLIESKMRKLGLGEPQGFRIFRDVIRTPDDGIIIFKGMNEYNDDSIKSLEGFRRAWWEEAHGAKQGSLNMLRPTLRASGSELWFSWNPRFKSDAVDKMFRGDALPTDAVVVQANWRDNPWFTKELEQERRDDMNNQPDQYDHIWEGGYVQVVAGAYYAKAIAEAKEQRRIGRVGYDPLMKFHVFCDLGGTGAQADAFTIWVVQFVGREIRVLNYYEAVGQEFSAHVLWLREEGYLPGNTQVWLPHDGDTHDKVFDVSFAKAFNDAGYKSVEIVPNQGRGAAKLRIEATRRIFPLCWFNEPTTEAGITALGWYHEKMDQRRSLGLGPEHDWSSHGSDSFGMMSIVYEQQFRRNNSEAQASSGRGQQKAKSRNWRVS